MTPEQIQSAPYYFTHLNIKLGVSNNDHHSYAGLIKNFKLLSEPTMGIFIKVPEYEDPTMENMEFIEAFSYDSPKFEYTDQDCPDATHVIVTNDLEDESYTNDKFLQALAHSDLNKKLRTPAADPHL